MIDHRNGQEVVFANRVGDELLVVRRAHGDHLRVHQLLDLSIIRGEQQLSQRHRAQQHAAIVQNIQRIDRFLVRRVLANRVHRLPDRRTHMEIHVFDSHNTAGAVFRIAQKLIDQRALIFIAVFQDALDHACGQLLQKVDRVVDEHIVQNANGFLVAQRIDDARLLIRVHIGENLRGNVLRQQTEHEKHLIVVQRL